MRTTIILKEDLVKEAMAVTGITEKTALIHLGLEELINKAARLRLIKLGGTMKNSQGPRRNRQTKE